jgi:hypothetical protein
VNPADNATPPALPVPNPAPPSAEEAARIVTEAWRDPDWGMLVWLAIGHRCPPGRAVRAHVTLGRCATPETGQSVEQQPTAGGSTVVTDATARRRAEPPARKRAAGEAGPSRQRAWLASSAGRRRTGPVCAYPPGRTPNPRNALGHRPALRRGHRRAVDAGPRRSCGC